MESLVVFFYMCMFLQTNISVSSLQFSLFSHFTHRFLTLLYKMMVYLLTKGRVRFYCLDDKERLNNRREMTVQCSSAPFSTPIEMHEGILGFGEDQQHSEIGRPLFQGQKVRLVLSFVIDAAPSFHWIPVDSRRLYCEAGSF